MKSDRSEYGKVFEFGFRKKSPLSEHTPPLAETDFRRARTSLLPAIRQLSEGFPGALPSIVQPESHTITEPAYIPEL